MAGVSLAKGASPLCQKPQPGKSLNVSLNTAQWPAASSDTGLSPINENATGADGPFIEGTVGGSKAIQVIPGTGSNGSYFNYLELYFTAAGAVPAGVAKVLLCLSFYDSPAGIPLAAQYSGTSSVGPVNGAYDAAPEVYVTSGAKQWEVASFTFTGINFSGKENGGADFRVTSYQAHKSPTPFWVNRAWLVTKGVPAKKALAQPPSIPGNK